jgi:hypothetical protein
MNSVRKVILSLKNHHQKQGDSHWMDKGFPKSQDFKALVENVMRKI